MTRFQRSFILIILAQAFCLIVGLWINNRLINALSSDEFLAARGTSVKRTANPASDLSTACFAYTNGVEISEKQISTSKLNTSTSIFAANGFTFIWVIAIQAVLVYFVLNRVKTELDTENQKNYHESLAKTRDLSQTRDAIIFGLAQLAESRDRDTGQHLERIALYSTRLASAVRHDPRFQKHVSPSFVRLIGISSALHDIGKVPEEEAETPHAILGMEWAEKYGEIPEVCNAIGAHHDEIEMTSLLSPIVQVCDAISGARPGARRQVLDSYVQRLKDLENIAYDFNGVNKAYAIQAGRELRVIVESEKVTDDQSAELSFEISQKIQTDMTYPGQVKVTVIRETRAVNVAK